ncbi:MAG: acyl-ACP--UDP-N-acetylglucosamine O-acyltransferase [Phycisphaeraceae bacterium]|nr:acyl-ACP--UDP-N-acetylglucosamine O-acyltransferase [Phycisphaeraceae bacterium]
MPGTAIATATSVHPTATIDPTAVIGEGVLIEADVFIGPRCVIGEGCRLRARSMVLEHTTLGARCDVHPYAVLGGDPQDFKYDGSTPGALVVGEGNIFREGVTVSRSVGDEHPTTIGDGNFFMANSHAGHNTVMGNNCVLANGTLLAGHVRIGDRCFFGGNCCVHQFCDIGSGVMLQGGGLASMHVIPYGIVSGLNTLAGINLVGLRRTPGCTKQDISEVQRVHRTLFRERRPLSAALGQLEGEAWGPFAQRMIDFARRVRDAQPPRARGMAAPAP